MHKWESNLSFQRHCKIYLNLTFPPVQSSTVHVTFFFIFKHKCPLYPKRNPKHERKIASNMLVTVISLTARIPILTLQHHRIQVHSNSHFCSTKLPEHSAPDAAKPPKLEISSRGDTIITWKSSDFSYLNSFLPAEEAYPTSAPLAMARSVSNNTGLTSY